MRRFSLECGIPGEYSRRGSCLVRLEMGGLWGGGAGKGGGSPRHLNFGSRLHRLHRLRNEEMNKKLDNAN